MIPFLSANQDFPSVECALPDGLLAASMSLDAGHLLRAYQQGIFPWYAPPQPVLWWSPNPRMVLFTNEFKLHRSLRKRYIHIYQDDAWQILVNQNFHAVIRACSEQARMGQNGTWISDEIMAAYGALHEQGFAHSVETWFEGRLVAGLYGVAIGNMFYGESMFTTVTDGSKLAFTALIAFLRQHGYPLVDCQQETQHLSSLGGRPIERVDFINQLQRLTRQTNANVDTLWQPQSIKHLPMQIFSLTHSLIHPSKHELS